MEMGKNSAHITEYPLQIDNKTVLTDGLYFWSHSSRVQCTNKEQGQPQGICLSMPAHAYLYHTAEYVIINCFI